MNNAPRCVIVTPYYREPRSLIERCIRSVQRQSVYADHFVVADGFPQGWINLMNVRHIQLDLSHGDYGGTPRSIGAMLAISEGYDAIACLDADNWLEPDHVEHCLHTARAAGNECDYVAARWILRRPDGSVIPILGEPIDEHVDTNCFFFLKGSFHMLPIWGLMPKQAAPVGDRFFFDAVREQRLVGAAASKPTVNYHCLWESVYRGIGETPPSDAKPDIDQMAVLRWRVAMSQRDKNIASRLMMLRAIRELK
jgi:glycosyltransferase involved in cell wall biosynthesis